MSINTAKKRTKVKVLVIVSAFVLTAVAAFIVSGVCKGQDDGLGFVTDLGKAGGVDGFLAQFFLEVDREESIREITLPSEDDRVFSDYCNFQSEIGLKLLEFSGKKVEERYLRLKNKSERGKALFAVLYTYKERVIAVHLTTLEQGSELIPIVAFG